MSNVSNPVQERLGETGPRLGDVAVQAWTDLLGKPGAYLRGAIAGRPGERATSEELLQQWGSPSTMLHRAAVGLYTDPLLYASTVPRAVSQVGGLNPLLKSMGEFAADESGVLDWSKIARAFRDPEERAMLRAGDPAAFAARRGLALSDIPARRAEVLGERVGVPVVFARPGTEGGMATYRPWSREVAIPPEPRWFDPGLMQREMLEHGNTGRAFPPYLSTRSPLHMATHELGHALQHAGQGLSDVEYMRGSGGELTPDMQDLVRRQVSNLAARNPHEMVAETAAKQALRPWEPLHPDVARYYQERGGPDVGPLLDAIRRGF